MNFTHLKTSSKTSASNSVSTDFQLFSVHILLTPELCQSYPEWYILWELEPAEGNRAVTSERAVVSGVEAFRSSTHIRLHRESDLLLERDMSLCKCILDLLLAWRIDLAVLSQY